jgi:SAM-dependent methyltransferase
MPELRSILSFPRIYHAFSNVVGGPTAIKIFVEEYVGPTAQSRMLDIGCGPGTVVPYFPHAEYVGFDISRAYIESARRRFPQATFVCARVSQYTLPQRSYFDIVLALGLIHHLDDVEARQLFEIAYQALKPGGKLVTCDGVYVKGQSLSARCLIGFDRGDNVRDEEGYLRIASQVFSNIKSTIRDDLLRIPYTHIIMECVRGVAE